MEERLQVIEYNGVKIMLMDLSNVLDDNVILDLHKKSLDLTIQHKIRLYIIDITNTHTTKAVKESSKQLIADMEANVGKIYNTLVGLSGIQKIIANAISKDIYFAKDREDAKRWLFEQSKKF